MQRVRLCAMAFALSFVLSGCGVVLWGTPLFIVATTKKTTLTKTSAPDAQPTAANVPGFATLKLDATKVTATRGGQSVSDFPVTGVLFPAGFGEALSNRDAGTTLVSGDRIVIRVNQDVTQELLFTAADVASTGTQVASVIQAKVRALTPTSKDVPPEAYTLFRATFEPSTLSYRFVSGAPGETSEVAFETKPRTGTGTTDTVKPDAVSTATATRLGLGIAQGGIETAGADSVSVTVLNAGDDTVPSGTAIDLWLSHDKTLDKNIALHFDTITTDKTIAVGEARRYFRRNGTAPPVTILRQDVTPGIYYVIFDVASSNGEKILTNNTIASSHAVQVYQPASEPDATSPATVNDLDFVIAATNSPISIVSGKDFSASLAITNVGAKVPSTNGQGVPIGIDMLLSSDKSFDAAAELRDPAGVIAGVRINPTDPARPITVRIVPTGSGAIATTINSSTITVLYDQTQSAPGSVATVQSLTDALNQSSGALVDVAPDGKGNPGADTINALLAAAKISQVTAKDIFLAHRDVVFLPTTQPLQMQTFSISGTVRATAIQTQLMPLKLFPLFRITPAIPGGGAPENDKNNVRQAGNYLRIFDRNQATFDTSTGATLPTVSSTDFAVLSAVLQRPVNTGSIIQGHQRVLAFDIPDTGLTFNESQLLIILRTTNMDAHIDILSSSGEFIRGAETTTLSKTVVLYTPAQATDQSRTFYLIVAPARFDEGDLAGGGETFDLTISVNSRQPTDVGLAIGLNTDNVLRNTKQRFEPPADSPRTENNVLIPFSLANGKAEVVVALPHRARVKFRSQPVFDVGTNTVITQFLNGQVPSPVGYQAVLDETFSRIVYRPTNGDVNTSHLLDAGVYTIAFETNSQPDIANFRLEIDTQFISDTVTGN